MSFQGFDQTNILLNFANIEHDPNESISLDLDKLIMIGSQY